MSAESVHIPVMSNELLEYGQPQQGQVWIDGTAGGGGHSRLFAEQVGSTGQILSLDRDSEAIARLKDSCNQPIRPIHCSYDESPEVLSQLELTGVNGVLLDLGLSSDQLSDENRGFSFQTEGELDMRFDQTDGQPVWQWMHRIDERTLANAIYQYGEERFSRRIARKIVERRRKQPIKTVEQLKEIIYSCVPRPRRQSSHKRGPRGQGRPVLDPATRTFQALRIIANDELGILDRALKLLPDLLLPSGRILIISFHSLEDRMVKHAFREDDRLEVVTKKPLIATDEEVARNPRSRSAKLRVAAKLAE